MSTTLIIFALKVSKAFERRGVVALKFKGFFGVFYRFDHLHSNKKAKYKYPKFRLGKKYFEYSPKISEKTAMFQDQQPSN